MDWERERERLREMDKDKIKETDDEDTNRLRRSILTVASEPEPETDIPLETDMDATMELQFAPIFRTSGESGRPSGEVEMKGDILNAGVEVGEKGKEAEIIHGRRRDSQGSRILQTLLAAEPVTVLSPQVPPGTFELFEPLNRFLIPLPEAETEPPADHPPGLKNGLPVPRSLFGSGLGVLKQGVKASIGKKTWYFSMYFAHAFDRQERAALQEFHSAEPWPSVRDDDHGRFCCRSYEGRAEH